MIAPSRPKAPCAYVREHNLEEEQAGKENARGASEKLWTSEHAHGATAAEFCKNDPRGAWGFWTLQASYTYDEAKPSAEPFEVGRRITLARVTIEGSAVLASTFPSFMMSHEEPEANCCFEPFGGGAPRVLFINDQDGDGVPEIGIQATLSEGPTLDNRTTFYRFDGESIQEEDVVADSVEDVDGDGRVDMVARQTIRAVSGCDGNTGDEQSSTYVGHGLANGTFSYDDEVARNHLKKQCPERPTDLVNPMAIWCAKVWGMDDHSLSRAIARRCPKAGCTAEGVRSCGALEDAIKGFKAPVTLR